MSVPTATEIAGVVAKRPRRSVHTAPGRSPQPSSLTAPVTQARRRLRPAHERSFQQANSFSTKTRSLPTLLPSTMTVCDFLSLSVFQFLSILSFVTSVFAVLRMGTGPLHRLSHKFETSTVSQPSTVVSARSWSWSGLPVSFSLSTLIGDDEEALDAEKELSGYSAGAELVRMDWRSEKSVAIPPLSYSQPPMSMAKLIMSRHSHRKPYRIPRRPYGNLRPSSPSRLTQPV